MQTAPSRAAAFGRVCLCVFRELFLRRVGGRQRAAKLKQSHRVIIFSPVCYGLRSKRPLPSPGIKSSGGGGSGRQMESKEQPQRMTKTDATMMIIKFIIVTSFRKNKT